MNNTRTCEYCGQTFVIHVYSYHRIEMPMLDNSGYFDEARRVRGATNVVDADVCGDCLDKIRRTLIANGAVISKLEARIAELERELDSETKCGGHA